MQTRIKKKLYNCFQAYIDLIEMLILPKELEK